MDATAMLVMLLASGVCKTVDLPTVDGKPATVIVCPTAAAAASDATAKPAVKGSATGSSPVLFDGRFGGGWG